MSFLRTCLGRLRSDYQIYKSNKKFRQQNQHNFVRLDSVVDTQYITVGKNTYGVLEVSYGSPDKYYLKIGSYVSIGSNVLFLLANEHNTSTVTTYPFKSMIFHQGCESKGKGDIVVGDDVWIGANATICSGVTIGQGAIIASGAVVTKDIPPYAIVGSNPARLIRYRFNEGVIKKLCSIDIVKLFDSFIPEDVDFMYDKDLTVQKIDDFINRTGA